MVFFQSVGRERRSWAVNATDIPRDDMDSDGTPSADWLAREAKRGGRLMSNDVDVAGDSEACDVLVGGFRKVGEYRIEVRP